LVVAQPLSPKLEITQHQPQKERRLYFLPLLQMVADLEMVLIQVFRQIVAAALVEVLTAVAQQVTLEPRLLVRAIMEASPGDYTLAAVVVDLVVLAAIQLEVLRQLAALVARGLRHQ
jgi:hypothetical protein